jgi:hypothetical protein
MTISQTKNQHSRCRLKAKRLFRIQQKLNKRHNPLPDALQDWLAGGQQNNQRDKENPVFFNDFKN